MIGLDIDLQGDGAFRAEFERMGNPIHVKDGVPIKITALDGGMVGGRPSVAISITLPDGRWVLAETSLRLFLTAADALRARFGDPR